MTPPAPVPSELADLRRIPLQEMPALPVTLDRAVQRVLPGKPAARGAAFSSAI